MCGKRAEQWAWQSEMLRDLFGNPFRPVTIDAAWRAWHDGVPYDPARHNALQRTLNQDQPTAA